MRKKLTAVSRNELTHVMKCDCKHFPAVMSGAKPFEIRKDDRDYTVGDMLVICEWDGEKFTGRQTVKRITHITRGFEGLAFGYCVLGIEAVTT